MSRDIVAPRRIGPRSAGISMAAEEFDALPPSAFDERYRFELIRGVLVVTPPPGAAERGPNDYLGHLLELYRETHPQGRALDGTLPEETVPTTENRRRADRAIWTGLGRIPEPSADIPSIVVEFVSASRRDRRRDYEEKREEYLAVGVAEYWSVDRFQRKMTIYRSRPGGAVEERVVREAETYETALLPGFVLPIARLLTRADDWTRTRVRRPPARDP